MTRIDKDADWWLNMAKKEGDYPVEVPYSGTPCLCGARREEDRNPSDCERPRSIEERLAAVMRDNGLECQDTDTFDELIRILDADMKTTAKTISRLLKERDDALRWASRYQRAHGDFRPDPPVPDYMIVF